MKLISLIMLFVLSTLGLSACSTEAQPASTKGVEHVVKDTKPTTQASTQPSTTQVKACQEDDPCWDCKTMGNKVCGPAKAVSPSPAPTALVVPTPAPLKAAPETPETPETPEATALLMKEAVRFNHYEYIPRDEYTTVTYLGRTTYDRTNGDDIYSVRSAVDPSLWHSYRIVLTV